MPIHVKVVSQEEFVKWSATEEAHGGQGRRPAKVWKQADIVARGEKIYAQNCAACHQPTARAPARSRRWTQSAIVLDADKNKEIQVVLNGRARCRPGST